MKKKIKVITTFDSGNKNDSGAYVQAAVDGKGVIHVLRTGSFPFVPVHEPKAAEVYEKLKKSIEENEIRFTSPSFMDMINEIDGEYGRYVKGEFVVPTKRTFRPPSTHIRTHRKGSKIRSISTFRKWCMNGGPIYFNHKFMHYGFAVSMSFRSVCDALSQGRIWKAVRI